MMAVTGEEYSAERAILLLDHGASTNLVSKDGETALMVAADRYQPEIVKALLDHKADPNADRSRGEQRFDAGGGDQIQLAGRE